jgi:predicted nucleic acid-binding protein
MKSIFIDTWGWINLFNRKEPHHNNVSQLYKSLRQRQATIVTTDFVLDEVYTLLFRRVHVTQAQQAVHVIFP